MSEDVFNNIFFLVALFLPGFIFLKARGVFSAERDTDFSKDLYEAAGFGFLHAVFLLPPLHWLKNSGWTAEPPYLFFGISLLALVITPCLTAWLTHWLFKRKCIAKRLVGAGQKTAWDFVFSKREAYFTKITLKSGEIILGKYGMNSFSTSYPSAKEIYIEEVWSKDESNWFGKTTSETRGMIITENEISTIEFFIFKNEENERKDTTKEQRGRKQQTARQAKNRNFQRQRRARKGLATNQRRDRNPA